MTPLHPSDPALSEKVQNLQLSLVALTDGLHGEEWKGLDEWLQAEHNVGIALARELLEAYAAETNMSVDQVFKLQEPYAIWATVLANNLRQFRKGSNPEVLRKQIDSTSSVLKKIYARNGWEMPKDPFAELYRSGS